MSCFNMYFLWENFPRTNIFSVIMILTAICAIASIDQHLESAIGHDNCVTCPTTWLSPIPVLSIAFLELIDITKSIGEGSELLMMSSSCLRIWDRQLRGGMSSSFPFFSHSNVLSVPCVPGCGSLSGTEDCGGGVSSHGLEQRTRVAPAEELGGGALAPGSLHDVCPQCFRISILFSLINCSFTSY